MMTTYPNHGVAPHSRAARPPARLARTLPACLAALAVAATGVLRAQTAPAASTTTSSGSSGSDQVVTLSPFEVKAESNGYFQSNTMSGTRLNSKIEDLGQSISVMTKEQMQDFAMLDINDVFDYMADTEGTNTYSDIQVDRTGAVTDNVALDPNNANRVRGIGNANIAFNNIQTTGRIPVDRLWLDSIEVSRGPNANIFGLGNAGGTVNQVPATANVTRDFSRVEARVDSYGGWRASLDLNRILLRDKLALRGSYAYQHNAFLRKPSGENQRRLSLQLKAKPWKNTTLSLSWYNYRNASQRPNFTTPRDNITGWIAAGRPSWDPVSRLITLGGVTYGQASDKKTLAAGSTTPITVLPSYFNSSPSEGRTILRIAPNEAPYWTVAGATLPDNPLIGASNSPYLVSTSAVDSYGSTQPLFATYAALSDKSIYDWDHINLMSANKAWDNDNVYLAQLDQIFVNTPRHLLAGQAAFMREDTKRLEDLPLGPASVNGVIGEIYADPNLKNLDGTPNPYYGRPYLRSKEPFLRDRPMLWDTARAQLAYRLDLSKNKGWTKWLGTHQLLGYYEYKDRQSRQYTWRRTSTSYDEPYLQFQLTQNRPLANRTTSGTQYGVPTQTATSTSGTNNTRVYEFYYVGDTPGAGVQYAPTRFPDTATVPFVWGNTGSFHADSLPLGWTPSPDGSGYQSNRQEIVKTYGGVLQSNFLRDRLVTTFGVREDHVYDRNGVFAQLTPDLLSFDRGVTDRWQDGSTWRGAKGKTKTYQFVARPFKDLRFLSKAQSAGGVRGLLAEMVSSLSLTYNKSDSFIPEGPAVDLFLKPLPNQTGTTKDVGFWISGFNHRISLRYTHFNTTQVNERKGDISTIAQRVLRFDGFLANDRYNLYRRSGEWIAATHPTFTQDQIDAERAKEMGLSLDQINGLLAATASGTLAATQDAVATGDEVELYVNPSRYWTISGSVTKNEAINKNAGSTVEDWIDQRMPVWLKIEDPRFTAADAPDLPTGATGHLLWWYIYGAQFRNYNYDNKLTGSAAGNWPSFVAGPLAVYRQLEGRPRPQLAKYQAKFSTRYDLAGITENHILRNVNVGGAVRWIDRKAIGFYGKQSLPDTITELDPNRPIYSPAETYVDLFVSYSTKLFRDRVRARFQLNVKNIGEPGGGILPTAVFPDGTPLAYRIIDPRQYIVSASFDF